MQASTSSRALQRHFGRVLAALLLFGLAGCTSTALIERWKDPSYAGPPLHKVLVVAVQRDPGRRRVWESSMVAALVSQHIAATPSYQLFPDKAPSADQLAATAHQQNFDGVLATHFVGASRRNYWMPGYAGVGFGWRQRYFGYWGDVYGPGYVETDYRTDFQTDLFTVDAASGKLIWTGVTRSIDLDSVTTTTAQIGHVLVPALVREGILTAG